MVKEGRESMNRLMIDFETLDVAECPVILSMGAVVFNDTDVLCGLDIKIDQQSCLEIGCTISEDTVAWWNQQSDEAKSAAFGGTTHIRIAMEQLIQFAVDNDVQEIWSQGALADIRWVNNILAKLGLAKPWEFYQEMCSRTLLKYSPKTWGISRTGTHHNAYDDAVFQAKNVILQLKYINSEHVQAIVNIGEIARHKHEVLS